MHKALYRIHRPRQFADIVGQDTIVQILQNQISEDSLSHAYLFSGSRGTGKTSTAKVFSRAVNCSSRIGAEPCGTCRSCMEGEVDIIEIDAASNNSVDNIREIRENVIYTPTYGKYKIYIIDEVHMLSQGAFNALLKTLEEPPPHVIFILATTEPQKIPQTVLSRVQRYDFRRIDAAAALHRIKAILESMETYYEEAALDFIVQKSEGSLRDALSMLDKAIAFGDLSYGSVAAALGETAHARIELLMRAVFDKNPALLLETLEKISEEGGDMKLLVADCLSYIRDVLLIKSGAPELAAREEGKAEELKEAGDLLTVAGCIDWMEGLSHLEADIKYALSPRVLIEAFFLRRLYFAGEEPSSSQKGGGGQEEILRLQQKIALLEEKIHRIEERQDRERPVGKPEEKKPSAPAYFAPEELSIELDEEEKGILEEVKDKMEEVYLSLKKKNYANIKALLQNAEPMRYRKDNLYFAYEEGYLMLKKMVDTEENKRVLKKTLAEVFGKEIGVFFIMKKEAASVTDPSEDSLLENIRTAFEDVPIRDYEDMEHYKRTHPQTEENML